MCTPLGKLLTLMKFAKFIILPLKKVLFNSFGNKKWKNEIIQRFLTPIISILFCAKCYKQVRFVGLTYQKTKRTNAINVLILAIFTILMDSKYLFYEKLLT